jgi:hypothetical protein
VATGYDVLGWDGLDKIRPVEEQLIICFKMNSQLELMIEQGDVAAVRYTERGTFSAPFRGTPPTGKSSPPHRCAPTAERKSRRWPPVGWNPPWACGSCTIAATAERFWASPTGRASGWGDPTFDSTASASTTQQ